MSPSQIQLLQNNGLVLFEGGENLFKAGLGSLLTDGIRLTTHSPFSHAGMLVGGKLYESTRGTDTNGKYVSGPQVNDPEMRVAGYIKQGGHAYLYLFATQFTPDWDAMLAGAEHLIA